MYVHRNENPDPSEYWVVVGEHNREVVEGTESRHMLELIHQHPDYNSDTNDNDLALLKTKKPIKFNGNVKPLTIEGTPVLDDHGRLSCYVTGWGVRTVSELFHLACIHTQVHVSLRFNN